jgi:hypothetical protein
VGVTAAVSGAAAPPSKLQIDSVGCTAGVNGRTHFSSCTYLLTDGSRFRCPYSFSKHHETPATIQHAKACRPLRPIFVPRPWRRVFDRLYRVRACLARHGITAIGGPFLEGPRPRKTPIGELILFNTKPTAFIAFYTSARAAQEAEPKVIRNARRSGGVVHRRGLVTVVWIKPPPAQLRAATEICAF